MKYLLFFLLLHSYLFGLITQPITTQVSSVDLENESVKIAPITGAQVGMYGVIVHHFNAQHATALSWVEITEVTQEQISANLVPIYALEQSALPSGTWEAQAGDEVILGYNYHRSLLIAPNASLYKKVTQHHQERKWVHPDIFAAVLSSNGHPTPLVEDFQATCRANNIGLVSFLLENSVITVDCQSFKIVQNRATTISFDEIQLPFYTRVLKIEANWFGDGSDEMTSYAPYYLELLAEYNPENSWLKKALETTTEEQEDDSWF